MNRRFVVLAVAAAAVLAASCRGPCLIDPADAGCVTQAACADAGDGAACTTPGVSCRLCEPSFHSFIASCDALADGGAAWTIARGIPPPECRD